MSNMLYIEVETEEDVKILNECYRYQRVMVFNTKEQNPFFCWDSVAEGVSVLIGKSPNQILFLGTIQRFEKTRPLELMKVRKTGNTITNVTRWGGSFLIPAPAQWKTIPETVIDEPPEFLTVWVTDLRRPAGRIETIKAQENLYVK